MLNVLAQNWWALLIRGIVAILFGIIAIWHPVLAGVALIVLFGAYAFVDGIFAIIGAVRAGQTHERPWPLIIEGIVGIAIGAITFFEPRATGLALVWLIAFWAIVTGIFELVAAVRLRKTIRNEIWMILGGILSIVFGVLLVVYPGAGAITLVWLVGIYAIIFGIIWIVLAFRLRSHVTTPATA